MNQPIFEAGEFGDSSQDPPNPRPVAVKDSLSYSASSVEEGIRELQHVDPEIASMLSKLEAHNDDTIQVRNTTQPMKPVSPVSSLFPASTAPPRVPLTTARQLPQSLLSSRQSPEPRPLESPLLTNDPACPSRPASLAAHRRTVSWGQDVVLPITSVPDSVAKQWASHAQDGQLGNSSFPGVENGIASGARPAARNQTLVGVTGAPRKGSEPAFCASDDDIPGSVGSWSSRNGLLSKERLDGASLERLELRRMDSKARIALSLKDIIRAGPLESEAETLILKVLDDRREAEAAQRRRNANPSAQRQLPPLRPRSDTGTSTINDDDPLGEEVIDFVGAPLSPRGVTGRSNSCEISEQASDREPLVVPDLEGSRHTAGSTGPTASPPFLPRPKSILNRRRNPSIEVRLQDLTSALTAQHVAASAAPLRGNAIRRARSTAGSVDASSVEKGRVGLATPDDAAMSARESKPDNEGAFTGTGGDPSRDSVAEENHESSFMGVLDPLAIFFPETQQGSGDTFASNCEQLAEQIRPSFPIPQYDDEGDDSSLDGCSFCEDEPCSDPAAPSNVPASINAPGMHNSSMANDAKNLKATTTNDCPAETDENQERTGNQSKPSSSADSPVAPQYFRESRVVKAKFRACFKLWHSFFYPRRRSLFRYSRNVLLFLIFPATAVASILFYFCGNLNPKSGRASVSYWLLLIFARQVTTFSLACLWQCFAVDLLALGSGCMLKIAGPTLTLVIVQSKGVSVTLHQHATARKVISRARASLPPLSVAFPPIIVVSDKFCSTLR
jgi:hypothetical protein